MSFEAIKLVTDAEEKAYAQIEQAKANARAVIADAAAKAGQQVEMYQKKAVEENKRLMAEAELQAETDKRIVMENTTHKCEALETKARSRLDAAANLIVERIVNG